MADGKGHMFQIMEFMSFVLKNIQALFPLSSKPKFEKIQRHEGRKEERMEERKAREGGKEGNVARRECGKEGGNAFVERVADIRSSVCNVR